MATPRLDAADDLVAEVQAALAAAGLVKAHATKNAAEIPSGARYGVVVVSPPALTFDTWTSTTATWELHLVAGPANDYLAAWATLDGLIEALVAAGINVAKAEPGGYAPSAQAPILPSYTLTLNPLD